MPLRVAFAAAAFIFAALPGAAQSVSVHAVGDVCALYDVDGVARPGPTLSEADIEAATQAARRAGGTAVVTESRGRSATITVRYNPGFTEEAQAAFQRAIDIWADHIDSPVPVRVEANYVPLRPGALGQAGPRITMNFAGPSVARPDTWYPFGLADALVGRDLFPPVPDDPATNEDEANPRYDITATFSSEFPNWYFGLDGNTPDGDYDFVTVVLHELGHGLGFIGSGRYDDGIVGDGNGRECDGIEGHGCWGTQINEFPFTLYPYVFDAFVEDRGGTAFLNQEVYPLNSSVLGSLIVGGKDSSIPEDQSLFVDGLLTVLAYDGARPPLYAPNPTKPGSSFSHWDENVFPGRDENSDALMSPQIGRGESYVDPGSITCGFFGDMGWPLGPGCDVLLRTPAEDEVEDATPALTLTGPNPFRNQTRLQLALDRDQSVEVVLLDVLGRRVRTLYAGPAGARGLTLYVDGSGLAPGAYVVQVQGETSRLAVPLVRTR